MLSPSEMKRTKDRRRPAVRDGAKRRKTQRSRPGPRQKRVSGRVCDSIRQLKAQKIPLREIATRVGRSKSSVQRVACTEEAERSREDLQNQLVLDAIVVLGVVSQAPGRCAIESWLCGNGTPLSSSVISRTMKRLGVAAKRRLKRQRRQKRRDSDTIDANLSVQQMSQQRNIQGW